MGPSAVSIGQFCGRRLLPVAVALLLLDGVAAAQSKTPALPGTGGVGGGAGVMGPQPVTPGGLPRLPALPTLPTLSPAAPAAPAAAPPAARIVRFRCEVAPHDQSCREAGAPDGGGGNTECNCARDHCYVNAAGRRVCEKLR